ncbi:hypothetical protein JL720_1490 [Aureococcus anophagefferens]|nr:hypothetical protein JL720_1490 [Aureococcus anophagefferens]
MGSAASSAVGPSGYSLDDLLAHRSATGDLTAQALCDLAQTHFDVAWRPEDLAKHRVVQGRRRPRDAVVIDGDGFRDYVGKACVRKGNAAALEAAKAEKKTAGKGAPPPASSAPEIALHEIKGGGTVATLAAGWKKEDAGIHTGPVVPQAQRRKPRIKLDVLLLPQAGQGPGQLERRPRDPAVLRGQAELQGLQGRKHAREAKRAENFAKKAMGKGKKIADDPNKAKAAVAELLEAAALYASIVETPSPREGFVVLDDSKLAAAKTEYGGKRTAALSRAGQESEIPNFKGSFLGRFPLALERADTIVSSQTAPLRVRAKLPLNPTAPGQLARAWYDAMHAGGHAPPEAPNAAAPPETDAPAERQGRGRAEEGLGEPQRAPAQERLGRGPILRRYSSCSFELR